MGEGFGHSLRVRSRTKQQGIFRKLGFEFRYRSGTEAGFHDAGTAAFASHTNSIQHKVVFPRVLSLVVDRLDVMQVEMREAGIHFIVSVIELDGAKLGARWNHTVDLGDFCRFPCLGVSAAEATDEAVRVRHITDELHGVLQGLAEGRRR